MSTISNETKEFVGRVYNMLKNLDGFSDKEVRGVALGQLNPTLRESCFLGNYLRSIANVKTLIHIHAVEHAQAVAATSRSIFESAIEIRLIDLIPDSAQKIVAFGELERLKRARRIVRFTETHPVHSPHLDDPTLREFINREGSRIDLESQRLWPNRKFGISHWSQLNLKERAELVGGKVLELYESEYQMHSWYVHAGLTGVTNTQPEFYWILCGTAIAFAADSFELILESVIALFDLKRTDPKVNKKLEFAKMMAFSENDAQAVELWKAMIG